MDPFSTAVLAGLSATVSSDLAGVAVVAAIILAAGVGYKLVKRFTH
ncbi:MAG: hypothetical protein ACYCSN_18335 [Acidobacteriaceae bacterium]